MSDGGRDPRVAAAFVELADTLVSDYDVADLLHSLVEHCVALLEVDAAGLLLSDQRGSLQVLASSTEATRLLELYQIQANEGPCLDCFHSGTPVNVPDLAAEAGRWPQFSQAAQEQGFAAVHAVPMRLRNEVIGALNLFLTRPGALSEPDQQLAQGLADVATIGILSERAIHHHEVLVEQLQGALDSRVVIEQAKGLLAERGNLDMDGAFTQLRAHARRHSTRLADLALALVNGTQDPDAVLTVDVAHGQDGRGSAVPLP